MDNTDKQVLKDSNRTQATRPDASSGADRAAGPDVRSAHSPKSAFSAPLAGEQRGFVETLGSRLVKLQSLILAAGFLVGIYLASALTQLLGAHSLFEAAQLQRVLNQRYAKEVLLASSGVPVNYERTAEVWQKTLTVLAHGGVIPSETDASAPGSGQRVQPPADGAKFAGALQYLADLRQKIVAESDLFMDSRRLSQHRQQLFDELYRQSLELQAAGDAVVKTYDQHLNSGVSWWDVNAVAVELAERQRMLIQQHIKEVLFVAHGVPADYQSTRLRLYETAKILTEGGTLQIEGGSTIAVPAPTNADVVFNLQHQKEAIERFTAVSNQFLMLSNEDVERSIQLKGLSDLSAEFHTAATELLSDYRGFFSRKIEKAQRNALAAGILGIAFALFLVWSFAAKYVDGPARRMAEALAALRAGKRPRGPVGSAGDSGPLAEVARQIDGCSELLRTRQAWFESFVSAGDRDDLKDPGGSDPVAARLYEWHKRRGDALSEDPGPPSRWSGSDADNDITVIGRLPDADLSPQVNDSELLDQLIQRANELQAQNERLSRAHQDLESSAESLRGEQAHGSEERRRLTEENAALSARVSEQARELAALRDQIEDLRGSEASLRTGSDTVQRINAAFEERLAAQAEELGSLKHLLAQAEDQLKQRMDEHGRQRQEAQTQADSAATEARALQDRIAGLTEALSEQGRERERLADQLAALESAVVSERETARDRSDELRSKLEETDRLASGLLRERDALTDRLAETQARYSAKLLEWEQLTELLAHERESSASALEGLRSNLSEADRLTVQLRTELGGVRAALERQTAINEALASDKLRLAGDLERSLETLGETGARLQTLESDHEALGRTRAALENEMTVLNGELSDLRRTYEDLARERAAEAARFDQASKDLEEALRAQTQAALTLRTQLGQTLTQHALEIDRRTEELKAVSDKLEENEAQLWMTRKELSEARDLLTEARQRIEALTGIEADQRRTLLDREGELAQLKDRLDRTVAELRTAVHDHQEVQARLERSDRELTEENRRLASELAALRDALAEKTQVLASTEERLQTTRAALKTTLEDLQERGKP